MRNKINYKKVMETLARERISVSVHSTYISVGIWKLTPENITVGKTQKTYEHICDQMRSCAAIGAWGLVIHVSKQPAERVAAAVKIFGPLARELKVKIILEMVASKADPKLTYETPEKINKVTALLGPKKKWWGWCVDTAHLWGAGVSVRDFQEMQDWLKGLKHPKKVLMFHLNGSSAARGSGKDVHEIAFGPDDIIWNGVKPRDSGVRAVVEFAKRSSISIICEINRGHQSDVEESLEKIKALGRTPSKPKTKPKTK